MTLLLASVVAQAVPPVVAQGPRMPLVVPEVVVMLPEAGSVKSIKPPALRVMAPGEAGAAPGAAGD